jgi:parallel beta-helix repeat protein
MVVAATYDKSAKLILALLLCLNFVAAYQIPAESISPPSSSPTLPLADISKLSDYRSDVSPVWNIASNAQDAGSSLDSTDTYHGYIIQLTEPAIAEYQGLNQKVGGASAGSGGYKNNLIESHAEVKSRLARIIPLTLVKREYFSVFNGLFVDVSDKDIERIKLIPGVKAVYKNYEVKAALMDSVPLINADDAWALGYSGQGTTIAIIDTGIDYTHPDLGGCFGAGCKVAGGYDFVNGDADPMDDHGHGTHVAGIAAGNGALKGVAPNTTLYAYKVLNSGGSGWDSDVVAAIERSVDPNGDGNTSDHADVISMSLGVSSIYFNDCYDVASSQAVDNTADAGAVVVVAAGNDEYVSTIAAPGCAKGAITVGASNKQDAVADFSSRGPTKDLRFKPDVVAPGVEICSAQHDDAWSWLNCYDDSHVAISGTSMATPHVAGASALMLQAHPDWTPMQIKQALRRSAIDIGSDPLSQGFGRIDVMGAIQSPNFPTSVLTTSGPVEGSVPITGTAAGNGFTSYILDFGNGISPSSWQTIAAGSSPVENGTLGTLDAESLPEGGVYALRLRTYAGVDYAEDKSFIAVPGEATCSSCEECDLDADIPGINLTLNQDIGSYGSCIRIDADNVTLDCAGHSIRNMPSESSASGIKADWRNNVTVKNCVIEGYGRYGAYALSLRGVFDSSILGNTLNGSYWGLRLDGADNVMRDNAIEERYQGPNQGPNMFVSGGVNDIDTSNLIDGLPVYYFHDAHDMEVSGLDTKFIHFAFSSNVTVRNITMDGGDGIYFQHTDNSMISDNVLTNGSGQHILLQYSGSNKIERNTLENAYFDGILITFDSTENIVRDNTIRNSYYGVSLSSSQRNVVEENTLENNYIGLFVTDDGNTVRNNNISFGNLVDNEWNSGDAIGVALVEADGNDISNNTIRSTGEGYYFRGTGIMLWVCPSNNNSLVGNRILNTTEGIKINGYGTNPGCDNNIVRQNEIAWQQCTFRDSWPYGSNPGRGLILSYNNVGNRIEENSIHDVAGCPGNQAYGIQILSSPQNIIMHNSITNITNQSIAIPVYADTAFNLSFQLQGNYWGRTLPPLFCEYENQHPNCTDDWDSNRADVIDSCPYDRAYPYGEWPASPVCSVNYSFTCDTMQPTQTVNVQDGQQHYFSIFNVTPNEFVPYRNLTVCRQFNLTNAGAISSMRLRNVLIDDEGYIVANGHVVSYWPDHPRAPLTVDINTDITPYINTGAGQTNSILVYVQDNHRVVYGGTVHIDIGSGASCTATGSLASQDSECCTGILSDGICACRPNGSYAENQTASLCCSGIYADRTCSTRRTIFPIPTEPRIIDDGVGTIEDAEIGIPPHSQPPPKGAATFPE